MRIKKRKVPAYRRVLSRVGSSILDFMRKSKIRFLLRFLLLLLVFIGGSLSALILSFYFGPLDVTHLNQVKFFLDEKLGLGPILIKAFYGVQGGHEAVTLVQAIFHPLNWLEGQASSPEKLEIDIKFKDYRQIAYKREQALAGGIYISSNSDYVPATITYEGDTYRVDMRLKGDAKEHWIDDKKWSFLVEMKDNLTLLGMRKFALQHPRTWTYLDNWYFSKFLEQNGLIALRSELVEVIVNGDSLGTYYLVEHYDKRLLEHNERREGPILKLDDWIVLDVVSKGYPEVEDLMFFGGAVDPYSSGRTRKESELFDEYMLAATLFESFRHGELQTHEVFGVKALAKLFAIADLFGAPHRLASDDFRFYFNPVTSLFEPILAENPISSLEVTGLTGNGRKLGESPYSGFTPNSWLDIALSDPVFFEEYVRALEEVSNPRMLDDFFSSVEDGAQENLNKLHKSYPAYRFEKKEILYENQEYIRDALAPGRAILAYLYETKPEEGIVRLQIGNFNQLPIEIDALTYNETEFIPSERIILQPRMQAQPMTIREINFTVPHPPPGLNSSEAESLVVSYHVLGASTLRNETAYPWPYSVHSLLDEDLIRRKSNIDTFDFLVVDEESSTIVIVPGNWALHESVVIPPGYTVLCTGGTTLDLTDGATILSYSRFLCSGTEDDPVRFVSSDSTGQGLTVLNAEGTSEFDYVVFENLSAPSQGGWTLTGAVTFYESPVEFRHCLFRNSQAEDGLNAIRTDVTMEGCLFEGSLSDCFDWDFVKGTVKDTSFIGCGNDGLDISGSVADVANIIAKVGDKGISIGEDSKATLKGIAVEGGLIGIASKDMSEVTAEDVRISGSQYGIAAYQKKPEFGPGILSARNVMMEDVQQELIVEIGSSVSIDGTVTEGWDTGVDARLYPEG